LIDDQGLNEKIPLCVPHPEVIPSNPLHLNMNNSDWEISLLTILFSPLPPLINIFQKQGGITDETEEKHNSESEVKNGKENGMKSTRQKFQPEKWQIRNKKT
jgi:hypothetical protein